MAELPAAHKRTLRREAIAARRFLTNRASRSRAIAERLEAHSVYECASTVFTYVSKPDETDTHVIIEQALRSGRDVLVPRAADNFHLEWVRIESADALQAGAFGVLEPVGPASTATTPNDAIALVPGLAFDRDGYRLGWGKGYFDRFLATFNGKAIGLAFDCQVYDALPRESHDRPVNYVITETETIIVARNLE